MFSQNVPQKLHGERLGVFLVQHIIIPHSELVNVVGDIFFYKYLINLLMFTFEESPSHPSPSRYWSSSLILTLVGYSCGCWALADTLKQQVLHIKMSQVSRVPTAEQK